MNVKTLQGDSVNNLKEQVSKIYQAGFNPTLAILFSSVEQDIPALMHTLSIRGIEVFGSSTAGEIYETEVFEYTYVCMLMEIDRAFFHIAMIESVNSNIYQVAVKLSGEAQSAFKDPSLIVISSGLRIDGEEIIKGIKDELGEHTTVFGGMAGDDFKMEASYIFSAGKYIDNGLAALIFDSSKIEVTGLASSGWESVGIEKTITRSEGNIIYTIDGEPALDVFKKYFGLSDNIQPEKDVMNILGVQYPLQVIRSKGKPLLRAPLIGNSEDGSLVFAGGIKSGSKVKFSISPGFVIIDLVRGEMKTFNKQSPQADALLLFSCKARHMALGPLINDEVENIRDLWDAPLVGLFTYGELGHYSNEPSEFHNETCVLVVINEKNPS